MATYATKKEREGKKRRELGRAIAGSSFTALRHDMINSPQFRKLSLSAKSVIIHLMAKYNRKNNGDLSAPLNKAKEDFNLSHTGLKKALSELEEARFIQTTRKGTKNQCSLYALTCYPLNEVNKPNIFLNATNAPSDDWKKSK